MDTINFLLFLFVYLPLNIIIMLVAALLLSILNKVLGLNFPTWIVALSAGILVFTMLVSMIETSSMKQGNTDLYYSTTIIINIAVIVLMLTFSGIGRLVFKKNADAAAFSFGKSQKIAAVVYFVAIGSLAAIPALGKGKDYLEDLSNDHYKASIKSIIDKNDTPDFESAIEKNYKLAELQLDNYNNQILLEYLVAQNKTEFVDLLLKKNKTLLTYTINWQITSAEMIKVLIDNGMPAAEVVEKLTKKNNSQLVKMVVENYRPSFDGGSPYLVEYIVSNLLEDKQDIELFDYLVAHGLAKDDLRTSEATSYFIKKNDLPNVKLLYAKGFKIDTARHYLMENAISTKNLDMMDFLFAHQFSINRPPDEFTYVEYAILSDAGKAMEALLKLKPDVTTLHTVEHEGETNALLMAEKYERPEMLDLLKRYNR